MRIVQDKVYQFSELSEEVKQKVLDKHRCINVEDDWYQDVLDGYKEQLEAVGFKNPEIEFTGFGSQGDGACFTCDSIDFEVAYENDLFNYDFKKKAIFKTFFRSISGRIKKFSTMYSHERTVDIDWEIDDLVNVISDYPRLYNKLITIGYRVVEQIDRYRLGKCHEIYNELEGYYYDLISDEQVKETLEANDFEFYSNGELY